MKNGERIKSSELLLQVTEVKYLSYFLKVTCPPLLLRKQGKGKESLLPHWWLAL
jgi:hypothetical protein